MKNPLVSILIASYNKEKFVYRCLKSCLNQSYKNIEIIFVDDGSKDKSFETASKFKGVKVFKKKRIKSKIKFNTYYQCETYCYAFKKSKGKIVTLLDSDDFYKKEKIKNVVNYFNKYKSSKIIFDKPIIYYNKKKYFIFNSFKNKNRNGLWPKFPPTSCISLQRKMFNTVYKEIKLKKFPLLTIDFRLAVISHLIMKDFTILKKHLTFYFQDIKGESNSNFKKFGKNWWSRRMQAHNYMNYLQNKYKNKSHQINFDYLITKLFNKVLN